MDYKRLIIIISAIIIGSSPSFALVCDSGDLSTECIISNNQIITSNVSCNNLTITNGARLTVDSYSHGGQIEIGCNKIVIDTNAEINSDCYGYLVSQGEGDFSTFADKPNAGGGGGYGGRGGKGYCGWFDDSFHDYYLVDEGDSYGNAKYPTKMGSQGGGKSPISPSGDGGGGIKLKSNKITINGHISAQGCDGQIGSDSGWNQISGAGSGGSILIITKEILGDGHLQAEGGDEKDDPYYNWIASGGGGGGRVAILSSIDDEFVGSVSVSGGYGPDWATNGQSGTIYYGAIPYEMQLSVNESTTPPSPWIDFYEKIFGTSNLRIIDEFNDESYSQWTFGNIVDITEDHGTIAFNTSTNNPYMTIDNSDFNASNYDFMVIKMKVEGGGTGTSQMYWNNGNGFPSESYSHTFTSYLDGEWHKYIINMEEVPNWQGMIQELRFDPIGYTDRRISIDKIMFFPSADYNYSVVSQTDPSLIDCQISESRYFNCSTPTDGMFGASRVNVSFDDGIESFYYYIDVNVLEVDDPPTKPNVSSPLNNSNVNSVDALLNYSSYDEETGIVEYFIYGGKKGSPMSLLYNGTNSSYLWENLDKGQEYVWKVIASDGNQNSSSSVYNFLRENALPIFNYTSPANETEFLTSEVTINVSAYDPDGDAIQGYYIYTGETDNPTNMHQSLTGQYEWTGLLPNMTYYWQARAFDSDSESTYTPVYQFDTLIPPTGPNITLFNQTPKTVQPGEEITVTCTGEDDKDSPDQFTARIQYMKYGGVWENCQAFGTDCSIVDWDSANSWWYATVSVPPDETMLGNWSFRCSLNDTDGLGSGYEYANESVFVGILNTAPNITEINVKPESPRINQDINCSWRFKDQHSKKLNFSVGWFRDSILYTDEEVSCSNDTICQATSVDRAITSVGERWECKVEVNDSGFVENASTEVTVINTPPSIKDMSLEPASPKTEDNLSCSWRFNDLESSELNFTLEWFKDSLLNRTEEIQCINNTLCKSELLSNFTSFDESWECRLKINDTGNIVTAVKNVKIGQTAPELRTMPQIFNEGMSAKTNAPYTNDVIECLNGEYYDADDDPHLNTEWRWYVNGTMKPNETGKFLNLSKENNGDEEDFISCSQRVNDGNLWSQWYNSSEIVINGSMPLISQNISHNISNGSVAINNGSIRFEVNGTDPDNQNYTLYVCLTNYIDENGCQPNRSLCVSDSRESGNVADCIGNTSIIPLQEQNPANITYYGYLCDETMICSNTPSVGYFRHLYTQKEEIDLAKGWNLISLPGKYYDENGSDKRIKASEFLQVVGGNIVSDYNSTTQKYQNYYKGINNNDFEIEYGKSYYVFSNETINLSFQMKPTQRFSRKIAEGWNFVSFPEKDVDLQKLANWIPLMTESGIVDGGILNKYDRYGLSNVQKSKKTLGMMIYSSGDGFYNYTLND